MNVANWTRRITIWLTCFSLCVANPLLVTSANAQSLDLDPPEVDHVPADDGTSGDPQVINVIATDSRGIDRVVLFYKLNEEPSYETVQMVLSNDQTTSLYSATVDTETSDRQLSYYFEVVDTGGNRVLNALPFSPHVRTLTTALDVKTSTGDRSIKDHLKEPRNWLYVLAGAVVIGLLANQSGGGGENETPVGQNPPGTVPVTVQLPTP